MKKILFLICLFIFQFSHAVDPQLNVNFKPTKEKIATEASDKI